MGRWKTKTTRPNCVHSIGCHQHRLCRGTCDHIEFFSRPFNILDPQAGSFIHHSYSRDTKEQRNSCHKNQITRHHAIPDTHQIGRRPRTKQHGDKWHEQIDIGWGERLRASHDVVWIFGAVIRAWHDSIMCIIALISGAFLGQHFSI